MITTSTKLVPGLSFISPWNVNYSLHKVVMVHYFIHEVMITPFLSFEYSKCAERKMIGSNVITGTWTRTMMHYELKHCSIYSSQGFREDSWLAIKVQIQPDSAKTFHNELPSIIVSSSPPCFIYMSTAWCSYSFTDVINVWMRRRVKNECERSATEINWGLRGTGREKCVFVRSYTAWM